MRTLADTAGHPLPANVAPANVPVITPPEPAGDGYDLTGLTPFAVFIAIFGSALLLRPPPRAGHPPFPIADFQGEQCLAD